AAHRAGPDTTAKPRRWPRSGRDGRAPLRTIAAGNSNRGARRFSASPARVPLVEARARRVSISARETRPFSRAARARRPISRPGRAAPLRARRAHSAWLPGSSSLRGLETNLVHEVIDEAGLVGGFEALRNEIARDMGGIGGEALTHPALRGFHDRGAGHFGIVANPLGGRPRTFLNPVHQERGLVFHFGLKLGGILLEMSHP